MHIKTIAQAVDRYENACAIEISPIGPYPNACSDMKDNTVVLADFQWATQVVE
jgi:hypothetical protein